MPSNQPPATFTLSTSQHVSGALLETSAGFVTLYNKSLALSASGSTLALSGAVLAFSFTSDPMKDLTFKVETSYGRTRAYPVDQTAILLVRLAKSKTLLPQDIGTFAGLGFRCVDRDGFEIQPSILW